MSVSRAWRRVKGLLSKQDSAQRFDDTAFDFSDEVLDDDFPKFNSLKVVVSDESSGGPSGRSRFPPARDGGEDDDDDDSMLASSPNHATAGVRLDHCEGCSKRKELSRQSKVKKKLALAALLYFLFMTGELIGGYVANSLAIMTDALHMLTDLIGIVVSLLALWLSGKPPTKRFTFGFHRLEVISAAISVLLIYILTAVLLYEAVQRTMHQDFTIDGDIMLITAAVGVAVNIIMGFMLNQSGYLHSHSHGPVEPQRNSEQRHSHSQTNSSLAVRAAFIHALGDLVQSIGILIAAYIIRFKPEYKIADPICTYVFSFLVLFTTIRIMWDAGIIVLEGVPRHLDVSHIKEDLLKLEDVHSVEDLNVWALTSGKIAAVVHLQLVPESSTKWEEVQAKARLLLLHTYGMYKCSIQLQTFRQGTAYSCSRCQSC
ncbi:zinc transporter 4 isoform X1 [Polypterus senegalus]|uniref:zinc transporter 4 isoform X1 n=1 Tax=Polypterus senegalus TaxID=55291 RepID=UPI0019667F79|nr:zinc transporter 4 isoform X1 [Polypterus senegalus]